MNQFHPKARWVIRVVERLQRYRKPKQPPDDCGILNEIGIVDLDLTPDFHSSSLSPSSQCCTFTKVLNLPAWRYVVSNPSDSYLLSFLIKVEASLIVAVNAVTPRITNAEKEFISGRIAEISRRLQEGRGTASGFIVSFKLSRLMKRNGLTKFRIYGNF